MEILGIILLILCFFVCIFIDEDEVEDSYKIHKYFQGGWSNNDDDI